VSDIPAADQSVDPLAHSLSHGKITMDSAHAYAEHIISTVREPVMFQFSADPTITLPAHRS
jgi:hypothetical protein